MDDIDGTCERLYLNELRIRSKGITYIGQNWLQCACLFPSGLHTPAFDCEIGTCSTLDSKVFASEMQTGMNIFIPRV